MYISTIIEKNSSDKIRPLSSAETPAGYPNKNSNNEKKKKESARRTMGKQKRRERGWSGASPFPIPIVPCALYFSFSLRQKGASTEERALYARGWLKNSRTCFGNNLDTWWGSGYVNPHYKSYSTRGKKWAPLGNPLGWISTDHFASNLTV